MAADRITETITFRFDDKAQQKRFHDRLERLDGGQMSERHPEETGWLVENSRSRVYWSFKKDLMEDEPSGCWTDNVYEATRFARKEDAEDFIDITDFNPDGLLMPAVTAVEHSFGGERIAKPGLTNSDEGKL